MQLGTGGGTGKLVWVDSRMREELFRNVVLKVNHDEAGEPAGAAVENAGLNCAKPIKPPHLVITEGPQRSQI